MDTKKVEIRLEEEVEEEEEAVGEVRQATIVHLRVWRTCIKLIHVFHRTR